MATETNTEAEHIPVGPGTYGIIADIHGNPYALASVLSHGRRLGVERWLVLGDVVAMGPEPGRVLDQLLALDVIAWISGNTERYVLTGDRPDPTLDQVAADPELLPRLVDVVGSFAWTKGFLQAEGHLDLLRSFRPQVRLRLPDRTSVLVVHASLVADDGPGITPSLDHDVAAELFPDADAALIIGGHTHHATDITIGDVRFVNPGSISNHLEPDRGACYSILRVDDRANGLEHHELEYDKQSAIESIRNSGIPGSEFLLARYFGVGV